MIQRISLNLCSLKMFKKTSTNIIEIYKARLVKYIAYISAFVSPSLGIILYLYSDLAFVHIIPNLISFFVFIALAKLLTKPQNYKITAFFTMLICSILVVLGIVREEHPCISAYLFYLPTSVLATAVLCNLTIGSLLSILYLILTWYLHFNCDPSLHEIIKYDVRKPISLTFSIICSLLIAALGEIAMRMALDKIEEQSKEIQVKEKLSSVGVFVGGIAHEINNPLAVLIGSLRIIEQQLRQMQEFKKFEKWITSANRGSQRIYNVIQSLMFFIKDAKHEAARESFSSSKAVSEAVALLANRAKSLNIKISVALKENIFTPGNALHLSSVLKVLIENSIDALEDSQLVNPEIIIRDFLTEGYYTIEVSDNGPGIPDHIQSKIMDPFFTTKEQGKGSGMGLALAYSMCKALNWELNYSSDPRCTRFSVRMKSCSEASTKENASG